MKRLHHEFKPYEEDGANSDVGYDNEEPCRFYDERDEETEEKYLEKDFLKTTGWEHFAEFQFQRFPYLSTPI